MGRRAKGEPPTYRRHASGQAFAVHQNETYWLGKYGTPDSRARYRRFLAELDLEQPPPEPEYDLTLAMLSKAWDRSPHPLSDRELSRFELSILAVTDLFPDLPAKEFGPRSLRKVRDAMVAAGLARSTVNQRVGRILRWLRWGVSEELIPESVWRSCGALEPLTARSKAKPPKKVHPVADAVVEATLAFCSDNLAAMVRVHRLTGLRSSNLCDMTPADIKREGNAWIYRPKAHKGDWKGKTLVIALRPSVVAILGPLLDGPPDEPVFSPRKHLGPITRGRKPGKRWSAEGYCNAVKAAIGRARKAQCPIDDWHPHQLRHALLTEIREKHGAEAAKNYAGHAHLSVTEIYAERSLSEAIRIAEALG